MKLLNRSAITLLARAPFAQWIAALPVDPDGMDEPLSLQELRKEGNVYLIDEVDEEADFNELLKHSWEMIFKNELTAWDEFADHWPENLSYELFLQWFECTNQIMAFDVSDEVLLVAPLDKLAE
ncbi:hypothetical protein [Neptunomonas sp.]|uniref:hypothetical protein n=1 Tax=Neptunomonas sp. TaxID=1971898 RepID=UPI0035630B62